MYRLPLLARSLRWRAGASLTLLLVATAASLTAAGGPMFAHAADETVLHNILNQAPVSERGLTVEAPLHISGDTPSSLIARVDGATAALAQLGLAAWFGPGVQTVQSTVSLPTSQESLEAELVYRQGACARLNFSAGRCPNAPDEVAISDRSARLLSDRVGSLLPFRLAGQAAAGPLRVVGIYRPGDASRPYWWNLPFFNFAIGPPNGTSHLDSLFVTRATMEALSLLAFPTVTEELPLLVRRVHADDVDRLTAALTAFRESSNGAINFGISVETKLTDLLGHVAYQQRLMEAIVAVIDAELVLLALFVLYGVVARTSEAREQEVALAKLRGFRARSVISVGLLEPAVLLGMALPLGVGMAWLGVRLAGARLLLPGTLVAVTPLALAAAAAAFAGGLVATALGARQILTRRLGEQLRPTIRKRGEGRAAAAADAVAVTLAVAALIELAAVGALRGNQPDPLAVLAPGLVALAAGVAGLRLLPVLGRLVLEPTRNSRWVGTFLAFRQVLRRPSTLRQILPLAVAAGLATFAVAGWSVAGANRAAQAAFQVGGDRVLTVQARGGVDLLGAVRRADPGGSQAMAVVQYQSATSGNSLLAVDSARLTTVAEWPPGTASVDAAQVGRWLDPRLPNPVYLQGSELRLAVNLEHQVKKALDLEATVSDEQGGTTILDFGYLALGPHTYQAALPDGCAVRCRLTALTPVWIEPPPTPQVCVANCQSSTQPPILQGGGPPAPVSYDLVLSAVQSATGPSGPWRNVDAGLGDPHRWRPTSTAVGVERAGAGPGLLIHFQDSSTDGPPPALASADLPARLPAVVTPEVIALEGSGSDTSVTAQGLDDDSLPIDGRVHADALPRLGVNGVLVDLTLARRARTQTDAPGVQQEVWLSPSAGVGVIQRLKAQGLEILSTEPASTLRARLDHQGPALGYAFFLLAAAAAALLALGAAVFALLVTARRRSYELAVLRAMGVPRRALMRGLLGEQLLVLGSGIGLGVASGIAGALLGLRSVPELVDQSFGPPLQYGLPALPLAALVACLVLILAVAAWAVAVAVLRAATPDRLRVAPA